MEPNQKIVLILSYNRYPNQDAGAVRDMICGVSQMST